MNRSWFTKPRIVINKFELCRIARFNLSCWDQVVSWPLGGSTCKVSYRTQMITYTPLDDFPLKKPSTTTHSIGLRTTPRHSHINVTSRHIYRQLRGSNKAGTSDGRYFEASFAGSSGICTIYHQYNDEFRTQVTSTLVMRDVRAWGSEAQWDVSRSVSFNRG